MVTQDDTSVGATGANHKQQTYGRRSAPQEDSARRMEGQLDTYGRPDTPVGVLTAILRCTSATDRNVVVS